MKRVPGSVLEAARIDGAGEIRIFVRIALPLGFPGLLSAMVLGFIEVWGMIEQPMTFLRSQNLWAAVNVFAADHGGLAGLGDDCVCHRAHAAAACVSCAGNGTLVQGIGTMGLKEG